MFRSGLTRARVVVAVALGGLIALAALGLAGLLVFVLAVVASLGLGRFYARLLGGVTGDVLGAVVETAELVILLTLVAWTSGPR